MRGQSVTNRDVLTTQTALHHTLSESRKRIDALRRRTTWAGSVQEGLLDGPISIAIGTGFWTTVAEITVEQGRWFCIAGTSVAFTATNLLSYTLRFRALKDSEDLPWESVYHFGVADTNAPNYLIQPGHLSGTLLNEAPATLILQASCYGPGMVEANAYSSYLLAVPS